MAKLGPTCRTGISCDVSISCIGNTDVDCYLTCRCSKQQPPCSPKWTASFLHFESWLFLPRSVWIERNGNAITSRYRWEERLLFLGSLFDIIETVERPQQLSQPLVCNIRQSNHTCTFVRQSTRQSHMPNPCKQWKFLTQQILQSSVDQWDPVSRNELQDGAAVVLGESKVGWYDRFWSISVANGE